ncbi:hypothetical protein K502DRAFT_259622 [Neoconidiobolus thromboides FSU 785]|nr:hypothetical protein K502DRAFT_259622 [Neoconidiobolus thromboides FSU 785]
MENRNINSGTVTSIVDLKLLQNLLTSTATDDDNNSIELNKNSIENEKESIYTSDTKLQFYSPATGFITSNGFSELQLSEKEKSNLSMYWLHINNITSKQIELISQLFQLHPIIRELLLNQEITQKVYQFQQYSFFAFKSINFDTQSNSFQQPILIYHLIFNKFVFTFSREAVAFNTLYINDLIDNSKDDNISNITPNFINYILLRYHSVKLIQYSDKIEQEVDSIGRIVLLIQNKQDQSELLKRITNVQNQVTLLIRIVHFKLNLIKKMSNNQILNNNQFNYNELNNQYLNLKLNLSHYDKVLATSHMNYLSQISMSFYTLDTGLSEKISKLTAITLILVPITVIGGIFGMNCYTPDRYTEDEAGTIYKFTGIAVFSLIFAVIGFFICRRYKLI